MAEEWLTTAEAAELPSITDSRPQGARTQQTIPSPTPAGASLRRDSQKWDKFHEQGVVE